MEPTTTPTLQDGSPIPRLIYGTSIRPAETSQADVSLAIRRGYRGIDTASTKQFHSEKLDGAGIHDATSSGGEANVERRSLLIQTKYTSPFGHPENQAMWPYEITDSLPSRVLKSLSRSLDDLKVDVIDVYFLHTVSDSHLSDSISAWEVLESAVRHGAIRYLGVCNISRPSLQSLYNTCSIKPSFVQNPFRVDGDLLGTTVGDLEVVRFCLQNGIVYQVFGLFSPHNSDLLRSQSVTIASKAGLTTHQAVIRLLLEVADAIGLRLSILDGTTSQKHMIENIAATTAEVSIPKVVIEEFQERIGWEALGPG